MPPDAVVAKIARAVCVNFLDERRATSRHELIVRFEVTHPLVEMESRGLLRANQQRDSYLPSAGSFAVLPDDDELYQKAEQAFAATVRLLRRVFLTNSLAAQYQTDTLQQAAVSFNESLDLETLELGLYLSQDFGVLWTFQLSDDGLRVASCGIAEQVINLKEPRHDWGSRAHVIREAMNQEPVPIDVVQAAAYDGLPEYTFDLENESGKNAFWSLLHPGIVPEAKKRFRSGLYADAVLAALKIINIKIKQRTGLDLDGAQLVTKAFAPSQPRLRFNSPDNETAKNLQQGYLQIFAGTMMAVRNPKAHGFEEIDAIRCIHFLFLASLLAYKLDEAEDIP